MERTFLLSLHIVAVAAWLGGNLVQMSLLPFFEREEHAVAAAWHRASGWMARVYYTVAGIVITVTGIALVIRGDIPWSAGFVSLGLATVIIGGILGVLFFGPTSRQAVLAHAAADPVAVRRVRQRFTVGALIDTSLVVLTVVAMVHRWGL